MKENNGVIVETCILTRVLQEPYPFEMQNFQDESGKLCIYFSLQYWIGRPPLHVVTVLGWALFNVFFHSQLHRLSSNKCHFPWYGSLLFCFAGSRVLNSLSFALSRVPLPSAFLMMRSLSSVLGSWQLCLKSSLTYTCAESIKLLTPILTVFRMFTSFVYGKDSSFISYFFFDDEGNIHSTYVLP